MNTTPIPQTGEDKYMLWIKSPLEHLLNQEHTDFVIMLIVLPMLERYLREKSKTNEERTLQPSFYQAFGKLFPKIGTTKDCKQFWKVFRNGLAHQVMMNTASGESARFDRTGPDLDYDSRVFMVNAPKFAKKVMDEIEADFRTFEAPGSPNHLFSHVNSTGTSPTTESIARVRS
jgi:hypothetical protein